MKLYLEVTLDELELPIAVASSGRELAKISGTTENNIYSGISKERKGRSRSRFKCVEVEDEDI